MSDYTNVNPQSELSVSSTEPIDNAPEQPKKRGGGPRTPEGKKRSSQSARRHGILARVHVATAEDAAAFDAHLKAYLEDFAPVGVSERDLVVELASLRYRLRRISGIEDSIFALGHEKYAEDLSSENNELGAALAQGLTWAQDAKNLQLLSLYESRLRSAAARTQAEIERLQSIRKQAYAKAQEHAIRLAAVAQSEGKSYDGSQDFQPAADYGQFVYSAEEVARAADRHDRLLRSLKLDRITLNAA